MPLGPKLASFWRTLVARDRLDQDLDDEVRGYLDDLVAKKVRNGLTLDEARRVARLETGSVETVKAAVRDVRIGRGVESILYDARYALRGLRRSPGFAAAAIITLALGIGANTAIFSVVNAMLVEPLPYRDSSRLVFVWSDMTSAGYPRAPLSGPELNDLRERSTVFESFGAIWANTVALTGDGDPEQLRIGFATSNFFQVLGADPLIGRTFTRDDEAVGAPTSILLGWPVWQRRYGADPSIVGRSILVNGSPMTVVGVMPERFRLLMPPDAAVPDDMQAWLPFGPGTVRGPRGQQFLRVVGRIRPGTTVEQARDDVNGIAARISGEFPEYGANGRVFNTVSLHADGVRDLRQPLLVLFGGVGILLLIACVNVAGLLVARAAARSRETALRLALGAGRARLLRQCLVEGLVLTTLGALAGLLVADWSLAPMLALRPAALDRLAFARIDLRVLAFTAGTAMFWGVLLSAAPIVEMVRTDLVSALQREGRRMAGSLQYRTRAALVVVQIALGVVLLVGAGLLVRSFERLQSLDPGFQADGRLTFKIALPGSRYGTREAFNAMSRQLQSEFAAIPGITRVGAISHLPFDNLPNWGGPYRAVPADDSSAPHVDLRTVTPGLFEAIGATLIEGRFLTEDDDERGRLVTIVDDILANRTWPGESAVGKRLWLDPFSRGRAGEAAVVVGVVKHLRHRSLVEALSEQAYLPERVVNRSPLTYVLESTRNVAETTAAVRTVVSRLDPQLPVYDVRPFTTYLAGARATQRFTSLLAAIFAVVALTLACVGVYGVMAYAMARRRYEFGVRMALGARPEQVVQLVVREGARLAAAGVALGGLGALVAAQGLRAQLFGITPRDVPTYAIAAGVIAACAIVASWLPARRAAGASPLDALRSE